MNTGMIPGISLKPLVQLGKDPTACWNWLGAINNCGYGKKTFNGMDMLAHRWIWSQLFGPIPEGLIISQQCQNRRCVNPHHLQLLTQAECCREGLSTSLIAADVVDIKRAKKTRNARTASDLATRFGVSPQLIRDIWHGRAWSKPKPFYGAKKNAQKKDAK